MNPAQMLAVLALIGDLYAQLTAAQAEIAALREAAAAPVDPADE